VTKPAGVRQWRGNLCGARNANGTGAFMLKAASRTPSTVLKANPDYWGKASSRWK
jgi:ABC-type transport system substrate-binding protein